MENSTYKYQNVRINSKIVEITIEKTFPNGIIIINSYLGKQKYIYGYTQKECIKRYKEFYSK
jgi:hypothetical protein